MRASIARLQDAPERPKIPLSVEGQNGQYLTRAKSDGDIDDPDEAIGEGIGAQGDFRPLGSILEASDGEPRDPVDDGLRAGGFGETQGRGQHGQDSAHGPKTNASLHKELEADLDQIDFTQAVRQGGTLGAEIGLGLLGSFLIGISLPFDTLKFFAQVAIVVGPAGGFLLPLLSTLLDFIG